MNESMSLPYFAPESRWPALIPTAEEIELCGNLIKHFEGQRVARVGPHFIVKYGAQVTVTEGENLLFMREINPAVVPEVFAMFSQTFAQGLVKVYIVMEVIQGQTLEDLWPGLDKAAKEEISRRLRLLMDEMRAISSRGYFGSIGEKPLRDTIFWTAPKDEVQAGLISGPFFTEKDLIDGMIQKYRYNTGLEQKASYYQRVLPVVLHDNKPIFTHGDSQRKNIMVRDNGSIVLVDWETGGWYPEYWEYATAIFACGKWSDDWHKHIGEILTEYPTEYVWFSDAAAKALVLNNQ